MELGPFVNREGSGVLLPLCLFFFFFFHAWSLQTTASPVLGRPETDSRGPLGFDERLYLAHILDQQPPVMLPTDTLESPQIKGVCSDSCKCRGCQTQEQVICFFFFLYLATLSDGLISPCVWMTDCRHGNMQVEVAFPQAPETFLLYSGIINKFSADLRPHNTSADVIHWADDFLLCQDT